MKSYAKHAGGVALLVVSCLAAKAKIADEGSGPAGTVHSLNPVAGDLVLEDPEGTIAVLSDRAARFLVNGQSAPLSALGPGDRVRVDSTGAGPARDESGVTDGTRSAATGSERRIALFLRAAARSPLPGLLSAILIGLSLVMRASRRLAI